MEEITKTAMQKLNDLHELQKKQRIEYEREMKQFKWIELNDKELQSEKKFLNNAVLVLGLSFFISIICLVFIPFIFRLKTENIPYILTVIGCVAHLATCLCVMFIFRSIALVCIGKNPYIEYYNDYRWLFWVTWPIFIILSFMVLNLEINIGQSFH